MFPALAGVILRLKNLAVARVYVPRTRGGDPVFAVFRHDLVECSPHTRGVILVLNQQLTQAAYVPPPLAEVSLGERLI